MKKNTTVDQSRLKQLRELVTYHQNKYYTEDAPEISDEAYDALMRELGNLEQKVEGKKSKITEAVVGTASDAFKKVQHTVPQWSFDNVFSEAELREWEKRLERVLDKADVLKEDLTYVAEHKIDGLKLVIEYKKGQLWRAATRGDGEVGEDVTHTARTIASLPQSLRYPVDLLCVGEVWLSKENFISLNEEREREGEALFANPRNAAAGSLRQLDPEVARRRNLSLFVYDIDAFSPRETVCAVPKSQEAELLLLKELGLPVNTHNHYCRTIAEVQTYYEKWKDHHENLTYGVDGVVVKLNDIRLQNMAGYTAKSPRFGIAYKFPAIETTTIVEAIELQVGRTGVVTPVAHLTPVLVDGSTVARATLHNEDQIKRLDVRVGDTIILRKAGDVIPEIVSVMLPLRPSLSKPFRFPKKVSLCGGDGEIMRVPGTAAYRCVSMQSDFLRRQRLYYFVSKTALNIDGIGPKIIDALLDAELIRTIDELFTVTKEDFLTLPGFKEKSAQNAVSAIEQVRQVNFARLLVGLSIDLVGEETARLLIKYFKTPAELQEASEADLVAIHGIGEVVARSVIDWQHNEEEQALFARLLTHLEIKAEPGALGKQHLTGKSFVFTGTLTDFARSDAEDLVRQAGGSVVSAVSRKTSYVVVGADPGSKAAEAKKLDVPILNEAEFKALIA